MTRNGTAELSQSPEARTIRGFCGICISYPLTVWEKGHEFLLYFYISIPVLAARKRDSYSYTTQVRPFLEFVEETLREGIEEWGLGKREFSLHHQIQWLASLHPLN